MLNLNYINMYVFMWHEDIIGACRGKGISPKPPKNCCRKTVIFQGYIKWWFGNQYSIEFLLISQKWCQKFRSDDFFSIQAKFFKVS